MKTVYETKVTTAGGTFKFEGSSIARVDEHGVLVVPCGGGVACYADRSWRSYVSQKVTRLD